DNTERPKTAPSDKGSGCVKLPLLWLPLFLATFLGCGQESSRVMISSRYGTVLVGENSVLHQNGTLRLYSYTDDGGRQLIWPSVIIRKQAVVDELILFNGQATGKRSSIYYPAFFGYMGTGSVVELSGALVRLRTQRSTDGTDYSFSI